MAYATPTQVKSYLGITENSADSLIARLCNAVQAAINTHCRRTFEATTQTRRYMRSDRAQGRLLFLDDDLLVVTQLINGDDTTIPLDQFWLEPRDAPPYGMIRLKSSYVWNWNTDGEIRVTGQWGYSAVAPEDITQAAIRWAGYLFRQKDASVFDTTADPQAGVILVPQGIPRDVKLLLEPYRRSTVAGGLT